MPNIKSAKKRALQSEVRRLRNNARKTAIKSSIKKVHSALEKGDLVAARELLKTVEANLARAAGKGVVPRNTARRKTGRLAHLVAKAERVTSPKLA